MELTAVLMNGKELAAEIRQQLRTRAEKLPEKPELSIIQVGHDPASDIYIRNKRKACDEVGILCDEVLLPPNVSQEALNAEIRRLVIRRLVRHTKGGCMLQLPIPYRLNEHEVIAEIPPEMDADGLHEANAGKLMRGQDGIIPCTPKGILRLLQHYQIPLSGKHAVIIGRSNIVGKPMAMLLLRENCTVTICHSHTSNLADLTRTADILICAVGKPGFITGDMVKPGAAVVDVGINRVDDKVVGDVDFDSVSSVAGYITPVPGGVGPMTVAALLENVVEIVERR